MTIQIINHTLNIYIREVAYVWTYQIPTHTKGYVNYCNNCKWNPKNTKKELSVL